MLANPHFQKLKSAYIFPIIEKKLESLDAKNIINLGIGDVSLPLAPAIGNAIKSAVDEMMEESRGYGPCGGYPFLKEAICKDQYALYGITADEIFVSDGANPDSSCIQELFHPEATALIADPTYPVYRDANLMAGKNVRYFPMREEDNFIPRPPKERADFVYLCTPCNPTGVAMSANDLAEWISWAKKHHSILIIDNVYNAFVSSEDVPDSIYALEGAKDVAIELRSFSKSAGFTGLRCGYAVVPKALPENLHELWVQRVDIKTNGISYPIQKGAEACFSKQTKKEINAQIATYKKAGKILLDGLEKLGQTFFGGKDAPYIWWKGPSEMTSWEFFDFLLHTCQIVTIPGSGFGKEGEGYVRLSCFTTEEKATKAIERIQNNALPHQFSAT